MWGLGNLGLRVWGLGFRVRHFMVKGVGILWVWSLGVWGLWPSTLPASQT